MRFTVTTAPSVEPVSLAEAKEHLRVIHDDDDAYIELLITAARAYVEEHSARALCTQTITLKLPRFPARIELPRPPLASVTSITYVDGDGTTQTLSSSNYRVSTSGEPGFIDPAYNISWPTTRDIADAVTVVYVAGYGAAAAVPSLVKQAIKLMVAHLYETREPVNVGNIVTEIPRAMQSLLGLISWGDR